MVWIPPVSIPDVSTRDYSQQLYNAAAGPGETIYRQRRDRVEDLQFASEQERLRADAERNYALDLQKLEMGVGADDEKWYGSPQWYDMGGGKMGFGVLSDRGNFREMPAPEGGSWAPPVTYITTEGGEVAVPTRGGGGPLSTPVPGSAPGAVKAATTAGDIQGGVMANLPAARIQFQAIKDQIDKVKNDPSLGLVLGGGGSGGFGGILPTQASLSANVRDEGARVQNDLNYLRSQVFPIAYEMIRGAGPIAIYESQAAGAALQKLENQQLADKDFKAAMDDFSVKMDVMLRALEAKAQGTAPATGPAPSTNVITEPSRTTPNGTGVRSTGR